MDSEEIPLGDNELSSELTGLNKESFFNKKMLIGIIATSVFLVIIIIIILAIALNKDDSKNDSKNEDDNKVPRTKIAEINCVYDVQIITGNTVLLGANFKKNTDLDIFIGNNSIKYSKEYNFEKFGNNTVKYVIYENLDMNYMFQDVPNLISIEMVSDKNAKIISMISAFDNCENLEEITIRGFDTSEIKSMHKLFYKTSLVGLTGVNLNAKNVEDMSYMFSLSSFQELNLSFIESKKVMNISHMFEGCSSLNHLVLDNLDTSQVKDMSYLFQSCSALSDLDLSTFRTEKVINMSHMFENCFSLYSLSFSEFNTASVTDFSSMFANCNYLSQLDLSSFDTSNVTNM